MKKTKKNSKSKKQIKQKKDKVFILDEGAVWNNPKYKKSLMK